MCMRMYMHMYMYIHNMAFLHSEFWLVNARSVFFRIQTDFPDVFLVGENFKDFCIEKHAY